MSEQRPFSFEGPQLYEDALRAQLLARNRHWISHELKNGLQGLHSGIEILSKTLSAPSARSMSPTDCLQLMRQQLASLQHTLHQLVEDLAPEAGAPEVFDLCEVLTRAVRCVDKETEARQISIEAPANLAIYAHRGAVDRLVRTLLLAAVDMSVASATIEIQVTRQQQAGALAITLRNPVSHALAPSTASSAIADVLQGMATRERGTFALDQNEDRALLTTRLPLAGGTASEPIDAGDDASTMTVTPLAQVLIVDDHRDTADTLAMLCEMSGCSAACAYSVDDALARIGQLHPRTIWFGVALPGVAGFAARARAISVLPPLLVSMSDQPTDTLHGEADVNLLTPVDLPAIQSILLLLQKQPTASKQGQS